MESKNLPQPITKLDKHPVEMPLINYKQSQLDYKQLNQTLNRNNKNQLMKEHQKMMNWPKKEITCNRMKMICYNTKTY